MDQKKKLKHNLCFLHTYTIELWHESRGLWYTNSLVQPESSLDGTYTKTCFIRNNHKVMEIFWEYLLTRDLKDGICEIIRYTSTSTLEVSIFVVLLFVGLSCKRFIISVRHAAYLFLSSSSTRLSWGDNFYVSDDKSSISVLLYKRKSATKNFEISQ